MGSGNFIVENIEILLPVTRLVTLCVLHRAFERIRGGGGILHGVLADKMLDHIAMTQKYSPNLKGWIMPHN